MKSFPKQSVPMLLLFGVLLLPLVSDSVPAEDHGNKREAPMRLESLAHGKTELMTYLVSQPIHEGEYGRDGTCDLAVTMRNIGAKHIDLDSLQVSAVDQDGQAIKAIIISPPQPISIGALTIWQIRLLPIEHWPKSVALRFRSHSNAFTKFDVATSKFAMLQNAPR